MAEDPEKKFHSIMDKLFSASSKTSSSAGESSRGRKRPNPDSALSCVEPRSNAADIFDASRRSSVARSDAPLCRPWDRGDLMRRLATFKSMTWFAKPKVVSAVNCARRGWINVETDIIACESCGARLLFSTPSSWGQQQVEKAALVFSLKLDSGHKLLCPWVDNACAERLAEFPPTPFPILVDKFKERSSKLLHLLALPVVSSSAIEHMRSPLLEEFLSQSTTLDLGNGSVSMSQMELVGNENDAENVKLYYQAQKLISLCGWVPRSLPYVVDCMEKPTGSERQSSSINVHSAATEEITEVTEEATSHIGSHVDPNSVVLDCGLCGASVGLWTYSTVPRPRELFRLSGRVEMSSNPTTGQETEDPANKGGGAASSSSNSLLSPPSSMKFTIAGGPPPTKQNFKATISVPIIGRNLRARLSDDIDFGDRSNGNGSQPDSASQSDKTLSKASDQELQVSTNNDQSSALDAEGCETPQRLLEGSTSVAPNIESNQAETEGVIEEASEKQVVAYGTGKDVKELSAGGTTMDFDPIRSHRHFCPWIISSNSGAPGWQQTLTALQRQNNPSSSSPKTPRSTSSIFKVDDPITSVRKLFRSPSAKRAKVTPGSS
ncbi:Zinc finger C3HC-type protein 1 [Linum grandiflorum]